MATDYYVKNGGDNAKSGLDDANAWETIAKVNAEMGNFDPGDTIHFKCGSTWREKIIITAAASGSDGSPVTFTSYDTGDQPSINGGTIESSWTQEGSYYYASGYATDPGAVVKDDVLLKRLTTKEAVDQVDEWWHDAPNERVYVYFNPSGNTMEISTTNAQSFYIPTNTQYITIDDICFENWDRGITVFSGTTVGINIQNCTIRRHADWAIGNSEQTNVTSCDISYVYDMGIKPSGTAGDASGYKLAYNTISYCGYYMCTSTEGQGIFYNHANGIIEYNEVHHCGLGGTFGSEHGIYSVGVGSIVRYNNLHDNVCGAGISVCASNMEVYYNLTYSNGIGIIQNYDVTGCKINNNVIYKNTSAIHADECGFALNNGVVAEFKNNIVYMNGGGASGVYSKQIWIRIGSPDDITDCNYNLIYGSDADQCRVVSTGYTWAEWQSAGYDANSLNTATHGMTDPDNGDFTLQFGSPCMNAGAHVALATDYTGTAHVPTGHAPDMGAYEHKGGGNSTFL